MFISSIETYLPGHCITNEELCNFINFRPQLIEKLFGNHGRYVSLDLKTGKIHYNAADLLVIVLKKLLAENNKETGDIEFIISSTALPDHLLPTSINQACYQLGLKHIETYQIIGGCSGALQALKLAKYILASSSFKKGIVVGFECTNKFWNIFQKDSVMNSKEMVNYVLFGDAIGGCIVERNKPDKPHVVVNEIFYEYIGLDEKIGQLCDWRGSRDDLCEKPMVQEEYKLIEKLVPVLTQEAYTAFMNQFKGDKEKLWLLPPQLSGKMVEKLCNYLNFPINRTFSLVSKIANCANAAIYFQLEEFYKHAKNAENGLAISIESSRWLTSRMHLIKEEG